MAARYLLDTDICIYIQRERPPAVLRRFRKLKAGSLAISTITWGELCFGAAQSNQRAAVSAALEDFISLVPVLPLPAASGRTYGVVRAALASHGTPIGNNDLWIAAHALADRLVLVTNNEREFRRVPRLKVENWVA